MKFDKRPAIGTMIIVHDKKPWKAKVQDYQECAESCVRVTRGHKNEEWIVPWKNCSPSIVNEPEIIENGICDTCGKKAQYVQIVNCACICRACLETEPTP